MESQVVFDRNVVELVTVAAEYCAFLEQSEGRQPLETVDVLLKLLPLLYLKASMLPEMESDEMTVLEETVTEADYDAIREIMAVAVGVDDDYLEVFTDGIQYSDVPIRKTVSEDLADIYQSLKNFVESYKSGINEVMAEAAATVRSQFMEYWGQTLTCALRALHSIRYRE